MSKVFIVVEMVFVKFVVDTVPMSTWTRVYYNNTLRLCGKEERSSVVTERTTVYVRSGKTPMMNTSFRKLPPPPSPQSPIPKQCLLDCYPELTRRGISNRLDIASGRFPW